MIPCFHVNIIQSICSCNQAAFSNSFTLKIQKDMINLSRYVFSCPVPLSLSFYLSNHTFIHPSFCAPIHPSVVTWSHLSILSCFPVKTLIVPANHTNISIIVSLSGSSLQVLADSDRCTWIVLWRGSWKNRQSQRVSELQKPNPTFTLKTRRPLQQRTEQHCPPWKV